MSRGRNEKHPGRWARVFEPTRPSRTARGPIALGRSVQAASGGSGFVTVVSVLSAACPAIGGVAAPVAVAACTRWRLAATAVAPTATSPAPSAIAPLTGTAAPVKGSVGFAVKFTPCTDGLGLGDWLNCSPSTPLGVACGVSLDDEVGVDEELDVAVPVGLTDEVGVEVGVGVVVGVCDGVTEPLATAACAEVSPMPEMTGVTQSNVAPAATPPRKTWRLLRPGACTSCFSVDVSTTAHPFSPTRVAFTILRNLLSQSP
jgi:hypothetical protein